MNKLFLIIFLSISISNRAYALAGVAREATPQDHLSSVAKVGDGTGVLIGSNIILTAGHVIGFGQKDNQADIEIRFPESADPNKVFKIKKWKSVDKGIFPTRYLDHSGQDLGIIILEEDAEKILTIKPMKLYQQPGSALIDQKITIAGFGVANIDSNGRCNGESSKKLRLAESIVKELLKEEGRWGAPLIIGKPGLTPCNGDSGGPAFIQDNGEMYAVGITSGPYNPEPGSHLGRSFQYADVGSALKWIDKTLIELKFEKLSKKEH